MYIYIKVINSDKSHLLTTKQNFLNHGSLWRPMRARAPPAVLFLVLSFPCFFFNIKSFLIAHLASMSLADAIVNLAVLVKKLSDDATENVGLCQLLGNRVELIPRLLEQFPHIKELDDKFLATLFQALKDSRDLISEYGKKGRMSRFFQSASIKKKFNDLDGLIGQCVGEYLHPSISTDK